MAKYSKRPDGRYCTTITLTLDGSKKKKTVYGKTIRDVDDKIAELRSLANKGIVVDDRALTFAEWSTQWLQRKKYAVSQNTYAGYENCVNVHLIPQLGDFRLKDLKKHHLQSVIDGLISQGKFSTATKTKIALGQIINEAIENEYIYKNISSTLTVPKAPDKEKRSLTKDEINIIRTAELPLMQRVFVDTLLYTGIRRGEALALTVEDIDTRNKKIVINKTVVFGKNQGAVQPHTKTKSGMRTISVPDVLNERLKEIIDNSEKFLFHKQNGDIMTKTGFRRFWEQICRNISTSTNYKLADDITPHIFRHTYATRLFYNGVDVKTAQYLLGHSSVQVTLGIYTHLENENLDKFADIVNNIY